MERSILVPIDFSDCTSELIGRAGEVAREMDLRIVLLHVIQTPEGVNPETKVIPEKGRPEVSAVQYLGQEAERLMAILSQQLKAQGIDVIERIAYGNPVKQILEVAHQENAARIVMGTHGRKGVARMMLGSVAEQVVRLADRPVLTIRHQRKPSCKAKSCSWCAAATTDAQRQINAEGDG